MKRRNSSNGLSPPEIAHDAWLIALTGGILFLMLGASICVVTFRRQQTLKYQRDNYLGECIFFLIS
jgi:hypothetical protein